MLDITTYTSIDLLPPEIRRAASYAQQREIFQSIEWFQCLQETVFAGDSSPILYVASARNGTPVGFAACRQPPGRHGLRSLANYYTIEFRPAFFGEMGAVTARTMFIEELIAHISREQPAWPYVRLDLLRSDRGDAQQLMAALRRRCFLPRLSRQYENWYLEVEHANFDLYFAARSSQLRNTIARKEKKARKSHNLEVRIFTRNDAELTGAIDAYISIYNSSWKVPEPHPLFIPAFARLCADLSILRLGVAYLDGKAVAAQLWINSGDRAIIYKLAYDEAVAGLSIGAILSRDLFRNAIDVDRVREIDYGFGGEPYKREWMSSVRYLDSLEAYRLNSLHGIRRLGNAVMDSLVSRLRKSTVSVPSGQ